MYVFTMLQSACVLQSTYKYYICIKYIACYLSIKYNYYGYIQKMLEYKYKY